MRSKSNIRKRIASACQKFAEVSFEPYKEAYNFIKSLSDVGDIETYIATEGHQKTQLLKIRQTGLGRVISEERVLSTDLVSTPRIDHR